MLGIQPIVSLSGETPWIQCSLEGNSERGSYVWRFRLKESEALISGKMVEVINIRACCKSKSMMGSGNIGKKVQIRPDDLACNKFLVKTRPIVTLCV